jgi:hypothetical protein
MDQVLILAYVFTALNVAGIAVTTVLSRRHPAGADRLVRVLRWGFPLCFLAALGVLVLAA